MDTPVEIDWFWMALKILAVLLLVALNGFFVAAEFALVKVRGTQLQPLVYEGQRRAKVAQLYTQQPRRFSERLPTRDHLSQPSTWLDWGTNI